MQKVILSLFSLSIILSSDIFINEFDANQPGTDTGEFIEIAGLAGTYNNVTIELINQNNITYDTLDLGTITLTNQVSGYGFFATDYLASNGIQNGPGDGIQLKVDGTIVDAVSYGGALNDANGNPMEEIEQDSPDENQSIGRLGIDGTEWQISDVTKGSINSNQVMSSDIEIPGCTDPDAANYNPDATTDDGSCIDTPTEVTTLADIQNNYSTYEDQLVSVEGVVTIGDGLLYPGRTKFYIQDESGRGIQIFNYDEISPQNVRGEKISVIGTVTKYYDDVEIIPSSVNVESTNNNLPDAHIMSGSEDVTMNGTWAAASGVLSDYFRYVSGSTDFTKLTVTLDNGNNVECMFWNSAVPGDILMEYESQVGEDITISGVITFYDGTVQLTAGYVDDIGEILDVNVPQASAGADQSVLQGDTVTLDASSSYHPGAPDQSIVYCEWVQTEGELVDLDDNTSCTTTTFIAPNSNQVLKFTLTVYDSDSDSDSDEVVIAVGDGEVLGCTDSDAYNYNPDATVDDGSCIDGPELTTIAEIQENFSTYDGELVTVEGVVTIGDGLLYPERTKFYIQDESGKGIQIFNYDVISPQNVRGEKISVIGAVTKYNDDVEIVAPEGGELQVTVDSSSNSLPAAHVVEGNEDLIMNGTWATAIGVLSDYWKYCSGNDCDNNPPTFTALTVELDNGNQVQCMFWDSAVPADNLVQYEDQVGEDIAISGVITFYNGNVQLTAGYADDIGGQVLDTNIPQADAGTDQSVLQGDTVILNASSSYHPGAPGQSIVYCEWVQTQGDLVALDNNTSCTTTTFVAPNSNQVLKFQLTVYDADSDSDSDEVAVTVTGLESIYNIQYTDIENAGTFPSDCFPSPLYSSTVLVSGVVTAVKSGENPNFYIQDEGDSWAGLYVYDNSVNPSIGEELVLAGEINEYYGFTQIFNLTNNQLASSGNVINPISINSGDLNDPNSEGTIDDPDCIVTAEQYEGMLVSLDNVMVEESADEFGNILVNDGSGAIYLSDYFYNSSEGEFPVLNIDDMLYSVTGVVEYSYGSYKLLPRFASDFVTEDPSECTANADINSDGITNVLDVVQIVQYILGESGLSDNQQCIANVNEDDIVNVLDVIIIVNVILGEKSAEIDATKATFQNKDNTLFLSSNGYVGGVQLEIIHGDDFNISLTDDAYMAKSYTADNITSIVIINPKNGKLFSSSSDFEIKSQIITNSNSYIPAIMVNDFSLGKAYPNPFNPTTSMTLDIPEAGNVSVQVYNIMGQIVATLANGYMDANTYTLTWDASNVSSGMYFVKAESAGTITKQKLLLIK